MRTIAGLSGKQRPSKDKILRVGYDNEHTFQRIEPFSSGSVEPYMQYLMESLPHEHDCHAIHRGISGGSETWSVIPQLSNCNNFLTNLGRPRPSPTGNGYSVLLAVCSAICSASFWSRSANLYGAEHFGE